jgi:hypothetical protein
MGNYIEKMWESLTTFTEESQAAIINRCTELGYDPNRSEITLSESFINLNISRDILKDAIEKKKLIQFPFSFQKELFTNLDNISRFQTSLIAGADEVINLSTAIETLYANIWKYGFYNLSDQLLGFTIKMNQLKSQLLKIKELQRDLDKGIVVKAELESLLTLFKSNLNDALGFVNQSKELTESIAQMNKEASEVTQKSQAIFATIQQYDTAASQHLANAKLNDVEIQSLNTKIKEFFGTIENYKNTILVTTETANSTIESHKKETDSLIAKLVGLEDQIKEQIQKATGFSLFHSFQTRQSMIKKSKMIWEFILLFLLVLSMGITYYISTSTDQITIAFYLKLSMSIPLIYAITFVTLQYSKERRLEEEYAFKSNISISLVPYKELVEKMIDNQNPLERERYTMFILNSIGEIFTSPTSKLLDDVDSSKSDPEKALKGLGKAIEAILSPFEPFLKTFKH